MICGIGRYFQMRSVSVCINTMGCELSSPQTNTSLESFKMMVVKNRTFQNLFPNQLSSLNTQEKYRLQKMPGVVESKQQPATLKGSIYTTKGKAQ